MLRDVTKVFDQDPFIEAVDLVGARWQSRELGHNDSHAISMSESRSLSYEQRVTSQHMPTSLYYKSGILPHSLIFDEPHSFGIVLVAPVLAA